MRFALRTIVTLGLGLAGCVAATAADTGSREEALSMVHKAVAHFKSQGPEATYAAINDRQGPFVDRDLYVVAYDLHAHCLAHGGNRKYIGKDLLDLRDIDGKEYMKERVALMEKANSAWQDFKHRNPRTNRVEAKSMYLERVGDVILGCGVYNK